MTQARSDGVTFDIANLMPGPAGTENFWWPVRRSDLLHVRDHCAAAFAALSRSSESANTPGSTAVSIWMYMFLQEVLSTYQALSLVQRAEVEAKKLLLGGNERLLSAFAKKQEPRPSPWLHYYETGLKTSTPWRSAGRAIKFLVREKTITAPTTLPAALSSGRTITTSVGHIHRLHSETTGERLAFVPLAEWFRTGASTDMRAKQVDLETSEFLKPLIETVAQAYEEAGTFLPAEGRSYLENHLIRGASILASHYARLLTRPEMLPKKLWTGTGGLIWNRLLRRAAKECGAQISGHDHGGHHAHLQLPHSLATEFFSCDDFITYNESMAENIRSVPTRHLQLTIEAPTVKPAKQESSKRRGYQWPTANFKRVMYVPTVYFGEVVTSVPLLPDVVAADWQLRLLTSLRRNGYELTLKPHPESRINMPPYVQSLGDKAEHRRFEEADLQSHILLFDTPATTTFAHALKSTSPIVVIDLGLVDWHQRSLDLIKRRCGYVRAAWTDQNRITFEESELVDALQRSGNLRDTSYADMFLDGFE